MEKASGEEGTLDAAVFRRQRQVLRSLPKALSALPRTVLPLQSRRLAGADALQGIFRWGTRPPEPKPTAWYPSTKTLATLVRELHDAGPGLILLVGKRSVGKTTLAAAIALRLPRHLRRPESVTRFRGSRSQQSTPGKRPGGTGL